MPEPLPHLRDLNSPTLTPEQRARLVQRLRRSLAALSLVGAALVALPLAQLLRYQSAEIKSLSAKRASLDPVARAVTLQRGLMAHAELAYQVLRGEQNLEADRRQRQAEVDGRLAALNVVLATGNWDLALGEAGEMRNDWLQLARQVLQRQIDALASNEAHRLLVEQTLQVIDLVTAAGRNSRGEETSLGASLVGGAASGAALVNGAHSTPAFADDLPTGAAVAIRALPRLVWMTSQLRQPDAQGRLTLLEGALARTLKTIALTAASTESTVAASSSPAKAAGDDTLAAAARAAGAASTRYFALLRAGTATATALNEAERAALQAQMRLFDQALGQANVSLAAQSRTLSQRRALLLGGLCFGILLAWGLVGGMRRDLHRLAADDQHHADAQAAPPATDGQSGGRQEAERLLQRLRDTQAPAAVPGDAPASAAAAQERDARS